MDRWENGCLLMTALVGACALLVVLWVTRLPRSAYSDASAVTAYGTLFLGAILVALVCLVVSIVLMVLRGRAR